MLKDGGVAIVSVLRDFILDGELDLATASIPTLENALGETTTAPGQLPQRMPSEDHPGLLYVIHPTPGTMKDGSKWITSGWMLKMWMEAFEKPWVELG